MSQPMIIGNWKMNTTIEEAKRLAGAMKSGLETVDGIRKAVCPPLVSLAHVAEVLQGANISLGAQNMHFEEKGAFTGEVSPEMLAGICQLVILGHSERRQYFHETDELINRKVKAAGRVGLTPILCVGERLPEREANRAHEVVGAQIDGCLDEIAFPGDLVVAYEPVWAIGTGRAATPDLAQAMMAHIRGLLSSRYGEDSAKAVPLLYGGSVSPANISDYVREKDIDGALVGGASLDVDSFVEIARIGAEVEA